MPLLLLAEYSDKDIPVELRDSIARLAGIFISDVLRRSRGTLTLESDPILVRYSREDSLIGLYFELTPAGFYWEGDPGWGYGVDVAIYTDTPSNSTVTVLDTVSNDAVGSFPPMMPSFADDLAALLPGLFQEPDSEPVRGNLPS